MWDPLRTRAIPERLRGVFTTRRYTNPRLLFTLPYLKHCKPESDWLRFCRAGMRRKLMQIMHSVQVCCMYDCGCIEQFTRILNKIPCLALITIKNLHFYFADDYPVVSVVVLNWAPVFMLSRGTQPHTVWWVVLDSSTAFCLNFYWQPLSFRWFFSSQKFTTYLK